MHSVLLRFPFCIPVLILKSPRHKFSETNNFSQIISFCVYYGNVEHGQLNYTHCFRASLDSLSSLPIQRAHTFFRQLMTIAFKLLDSAVERERL